MSSNTPYNEDDNIRSNKYNEDDNIDLLFASYHGNLAEIAYLFFKSIPNVNVKGDNGVTSLILASQQGKLDVVKYLLNKEAHVNDAMTDGRTALHMACKNGHIEIVKLLLKRDANQFLKSNRQSPRDVANTNGHTEIVKILDSYNPDSIISEKIPPKIRGGKRRKTIKGRKGKRRQTNKRKRT